jgi:hypothetical protein
MAMLDGRRLLCRLVVSLEGISLTVDGGSMRGTMVVEEVDMGIRPSVGGLKGDVSARRYNFGFL